MKYSKIVTTGLILTLMVGAAAASAAELTIFPKESTTEVNSFTSYEVQIENVGPVKDVYTFSSPTNEVDVAPRKVEIDSGGQETVNVWYNPEITKDEGRYSFKVVAASRATGERYSVNGVAKVIKHHNIDLAVNDSKTACLEEETVYDIELKNKGTQPETFKITSGQGQLSKEEVTLQEGGTKEITLTVSSAVPTEEEFNLMASSLTSYAKDSEEITFKAERCYASKLTPETKSADLPAKTESKISFELKNTGTKADNFSIETNMGVVETEKLQLESGKTGEFKVAITPQELGTKTLRVTANSHVNTTSSVGINAYNGMRSQVSMEPQNPHICEEEEFEADLEVRNTGEAPETFNLSSNLGELEEGEMKIGVNGSEDTVLNLDGSNFQEGTSHDLRVTSTASTFNGPSSQTSGELTVENCWDIDVNVLPRVVSAGENRSTVYEVRVSNPGTKKNTYDLAVEGPEWISLKPDELTVAPGETENAFIYAGIPFKKKGELRMRVNVEGENVEQTEEIKLLVGKQIKQEELKEALKDKENKVNPGAVERITSGDLGIDQAGKIVASVVVGGAVTLGLLFM